MTYMLLVVRKHNEISEMRYVMCLGWSGIE